MEGAEEKQGFSWEKIPYLRYFPLIFGALGIVLIIIGIYFTSSGKDKSESGIKFTDEVKKEAKEAEILVEVGGAVIKPGVYKLDGEGRFKDGLIAAGGMSIEADRDWVEKNINLAAKLTDGAKIYIPRKIIGTNSGNPAVKSAEVNASVPDLPRLININTASSADLDTLPGVGEVTAKKIIDGRPYQKIEDLVDKKIVNKSTWEKIKDKIALY